MLLIVGERKERLRPPRYSLPSYGRDICRLSLSWVITMYLGTGRVLADEDEENKAAPEKVDTSDDPEDELSGGDTLHVPMIPTVFASCHFKICWRRGGPTYFLS